MGDASHCPEVSEYLSLVNTQFNVQCPSFYVCIAISQLKSRSQGQNTCFSEQTEYQTTETSGGTDYCRSLSARIHCDLVPKYTLHLHQTRTYTGTYIRAPHSPLVPIPFQPPFHRLPPLHSSASSATYIMACARHRTTRRWHSQVGSAICYCGSPPTRRSPSTCTRRRWAYRPPSGMRAHPGRAKQVLTPFAM